MHMRRQYIVALAFGLMVCGCATNRSIQKSESEQRQLPAISGQQAVAVLPQTETQDGEQLSSKVISEVAADAPPENFMTWQDPVTGMEFVWLPGGCFNMGSLDFEPGRNMDEGPVHEVCVDGFWIGRFEVTNAQYGKFDPKHMSGKVEGLSLEKPDQPAIDISWGKAKAFADWLTKQNQTQRQFRLPTEAEWEYACRAGANTAGYWGNDADQACRYANVLDEAAKSNAPDLGVVYKCNDGHAVTAPVGSFLPNAFGLYDMLGNVWEWCEDVYLERAYEKHQKMNPSLTLDDGWYRVFRGGSWAGKPEEARCSVRGHFSPTSHFNDLGFRLVLKR